MKTQVFEGGVMGFSGPYASWPFGRLAFDDENLAIYGVGLATVRPWRVGEVRVRRAEVDEIRVTRAYPIGAKLTVSRTGTPVEPIFSPLSPRPVLAALSAAGWPVVDSRRPLPRVRRPRRSTGA